MVGKLWYAGAADFFNQKITMIRIHQELESDNNCYDLQEE